MAELYIDGHTWTSDQAADLNGTNLDSVLQSLDSDRDLASESSRSRSSTSIANHPPARRLTLRHHLTPIPTLKPSIFGNIPDFH